MLIYVLIVLFALLVSYQLYLELSETSFSLIEGYESISTDVTNTNTNVNATNANATYQPYNLNDPNNSLILSQQNAGNIEVLKGRIDGLDGIKIKVDDMQQSINLMQTQIDGLVQQQADYAQEIAGSTPATITGTGIEEDETKEDETIL